MDCQFARRARILKAKEYSLVFKQGRAIKGNHWKIIAKPAIKSADKPRLGLAISKKVCRLAVDRNRLKRIARETFRQAQSEFAGWEFVVLAKHTKSARRAHNLALSSELLDLFRRAGRTT